MKRYFILILAIVFALSMTVTAFADEVSFDEQNGGNASQDVTAEYKAATDSAADNVYKMKIAWQYTNDDLMYTAEQAVYTWNTETLKYELDTDNTDYVEAGWTGSATVVITVTNYSNAEVEAVFAATNDYHLDVEKSGDETVTLKSAAFTEEGAPINYNDTDSQGVEVVETFTYKFEGSETSDPITEDEDIQAHKVGAVTITVSGK